MNETSESEHPPEYPTPDTRIARSPLKSDQVPWHISDAFFVLAMFVFLSLGTSFVVVLLGLKLNWNSLILFIFGQTLIATAINLALIYYLIKKRGGKISDLGLTTHRLALNFNLGMALGLAMLIINLVSVIVLERIMGQELPTQVVTQIVERNDDPFRLAIMFLLAAVIAPVNEETLIRGFLYQALKKRWGVVMGVGLSAAVFTILHIHPYLFPTIFILGVLLALLFEWRRSLVANIVAHGTMNGFVFILAIMAR